MRAILISAALAFAAPVAMAQAPTWNAEQTAVWRTIEQSWVDEAAASPRWPSAYLHERALVWDPDWPSPRGKASFEKWVRFNAASYKMLQYEITPLAISVVGDTAVVHYTTVTVTQRGEDKPGRDWRAATETLVRERGEWKFLSLSSFVVDDD